MKRIKWPLIILGIIILCLMIAGSIFFPKFTVDRIRFLEPIAYSSFLRRVRAPFQPERKKFFIFEYRLSDSKKHEVKPLDKLQIQKMVKQLIPGGLESEDEKRKIVLSSANEEIMKDFQEHLHRELPEGWTISRSTSDADAVVTADLFILTPPKEEFNSTPPQKKSGLNHTDRDGNPYPRFPIEDRNEPPSTHQKSNEKPRRALFLYWIAETNSNTKIVIGATANYKNPNITSASKDIVNNLTDKNLIDTEKSLKIAVINTSEIPPVPNQNTTPESEYYEKLTSIDEEIDKSNLVTASILEEMINAKTGLTFLDKSFTSKYHSELKKAFWMHNNQKISLEHVAKKFSKSSGANAALIISQPAEGHFYLELMELPSLNILAIGRSEDQLKE